MSTDSESLPILFPPWKELAKIASAWGTEVHLHSEIAEILCCPYGSDEYYDGVQHAAVLLTELGKRMVCVHTVGYRILAPDEQTPAVVYDMQKVLRGCRTAMWRINCVPTNLLDDRGKRIHESTQISIGRGFSNLAAEYSTMASLSGIVRGQKMLQSADDKRKGE